VPNDRQKIDGIPVEDLLAAYKAAQEQA